MQPAGILEIACFNLESALIAEASGADRIELCENYKDGGLTPSKELIREVRKKVGIPIHVIIRPRANGFVYSQPEIEMMKDAIRFCKAHKINGVVFGVLEKAITADAYQINLPLCKTLLQLSRPLSFTFHRAIDHCVDLDLAFETLIEIGADRVLTSGGETSAEKGLTRLKKLQNSYGNKIIVMPGGGLRATNLKSIRATGCSEYHSAAITSNSDTADAGEIKNLKLLLNHAI